MTKIHSNTSSPAQQCGRVTRKTFETVAKVRDSAGTLTKVLKIVVAIFTGVNALHKNAALNRATEKLNMTVDNIEALDLIHDIGSLVVRKKLRDQNKALVLDSKGKAITSSEFVQTWKESPAEGIFKTGLIAADVGGLALWLDEFKVISLKNIAAKITSKIPAFSKIAQFGLLNVVRSLVAFSFTFLGVDAVIRLCKEGDAKSKIPALFDLAWAVFEVAAKVFFIVGGVALIGGVAGVMVGVGLSVLAASIGLAKSIYDMASKSNNNAATNIN